MTWRTPDQLIPRSMRPHVAMVGGRWIVFERRGGSRLDPRDRLHPWQTKTVEWAGRRNDRIMGARADAMWENFRRVAHRRAAQRAYHEAWRT